MHIKHLLGGGHLLGTKSFGRPLALASSVSLALLLAIMLFPALPDSASAEEATTKVNLTVNPIISVSLQDAITVDVTPNQNDGFNANTTEISVSTNSESGYSLYLKTANGENTLTSQNPTSTGATINAITDPGPGVKPIDFAANTWGYNLSATSAGAATDQTNYKAMPTTDGNPIITTDTPTEADTYNFTIGTKVDTSLPSGTYSNQVVVSAVANPKYVPTIQTFTVEQCQSQASSGNVTVVDTRDGSDYTVRYINGACWMTQNLRLSSGKTLTPEDSNVTSNREIPNNILKN